jgi:hypothetical protein
MSSHLATIQDVAQLEELLSEPTEGVVHTLGRLDGDIVVLGVAGKMGPTLARMAKKASDAAGASRRCGAICLLPALSRNFPMRPTSFIWPE